MTSSSSRPETKGRIQPASTPIARCSSGSEVRKTLPSNGPTNRVVPPTTAVTSPSTAAANPNSFGSAKRTAWASRTPYSPATAPDVTNALIRWRVTSIPIARAASSSSRMAANALPSRDPPRRQKK